MVQLEENSYLKNAKAQQILTTWTCDFCIKDDISD